MEKIWHFLSLVDLKKNYNYVDMVPTVWRFRDFSITQILREINFGESRSSKIAIFAILGVLNFIDF